MGKILCSTEVLTIDLPQILRILANAILLQIPGTSGSFGNSVTLKIMSTIKNFEEIISWQKAREINKTIGELISKKRFENNYRLINQIEASAGSIMDNIAEGFERDENKEFIQFLFIAKGSCGELRSQLYGALDRLYITNDEFNSIAVETKKESYLIRQFINICKNLT